MQSTQQPRFHYEINVQPMILGPMSERAHVEAANRGYKRLYHLQGITNQTPPTLDWTELASPPSMAPAQAQYSQPTSATSSSGGSVGPQESYGGSYGGGRSSVAQPYYRKAFVASPNHPTQFLPVPPISRASVEPPLTLTGKERTVNVHLNEDDENAQAKLVIHAVLGPPSADRASSVLRLVIDTADSGLWAYSPDYEAIPEIDRSTPRRAVTHRVDMKAAGTRPRRECLEQFHYADDAYIKYYPNTAPLTIITGGIASDGSAADLRVSNFRYQVACQATYSITNEQGVDGYIGFDPQPQHFMRNMSQDRRRSARPTLMNQLLWNDRLTRLPKIFVITPSYKEDKRTRLYLGDGGAGWPSLPRIPPRNQHALNLASEIVATVYPSPRSRALTAWYLKLREINIIDRRSPQSVYQQLYSGEGMLALMDTGTSLCWLPESLLKELARKPKDGRSAVSAERHRVFGRLGHRSTDKYTYDVKHVQRKNFWLQLGFATGEDARTRHIFVAPLNLALTHRELKDDKGRPIVSWVPTKSSDAAAVIGMHWLQYLWQAYHDDTPSDASVRLCPAFA